MTTVKIAVLGGLRAPVAEQEDGHCGGTENTEDVNRHLSSRVATPPSRVLRKGEASRCEPSVADDLYANMASFPSPTAHAMPRPYDKILPFLVSPDAQRPSRITPYVLRFTHYLSCHPTDSELRIHDSESRT